MVIYGAVSDTHLRVHETLEHGVGGRVLEKKQQQQSDAIRLADTLVVVVGEISLCSI